MPATVRMADLVTSEPQKLGDSDWIVYGPRRLRHFIDLVRTDWGFGPVADPAEEVDPFAALALIPPLLSNILTITDAAEHRITGIQKCDFISSIPLGAEVRLTAFLISGKINPEGHLVYQIEFSWWVKNNDRPLIIGELAGIAGNPG